MKEVTAALILNNGKILVAKRSSDDDLANLWEFPGGKIELGESPESCLIRELDEELGIKVNVGDFFMETVHEYDKGVIKLIAYWVFWKSGTIALNVHEEVAWATKETILQYNFAPADVPIVTKLLSEPYWKELEDD
ncbi:(deoxy)nucleoside triphosphate pyrophosphohydrolase [Dendrosporobacter sp. 1207_IL3150]|uniref:(deoxy)nucleoside triphosphate pyrophosphohydrolase n=1 Tax=Dendrosporobacter sp. 1207_IL3150 TaxID=3084054 RepID=UPI002FDAFF67